MDIMLRTMRSGDDFAQHQIDLGPKGQLLAAEYGTREQLPTVYLHGFMGSRLEPRAAMRPLGNIVAFDRIGYGGSTAAADPLSLTDFGERIALALDRLGITACRLVGVSAGGPFAAAAAAVLGDRVAHLSLVCALADPSAIGDGRAGLILRARRHLRLLRVFMPHLLRRVRRSGLDQRLGRMAIRRDLGPIRAADPDKVAERLFASYREGTRNGTAGLVIDIATLTTAWDFDLAKIAAPTLILEGGADNVVGAGQGAWWRRHLPDARHLVLPDETHISLVINHAERIASGAWD
ncbi:Pimeloyl-ACP methyl ester carboxylesterase [Arboricoccus pini]|uniref:Pimeloyl-ACP methyl ester carboxylesterase n=1 Tax=Arboricoccus pini TaxID=1963835 RepID=A0A212QYB4_9PROT|nr:alpha/beta hydrolase [Arboricoccus pini]SNB64533.1 Pimeloyl-ACP methyl ester carboxylesterase [Arboricoccus pini]